MSANERIEQVRAKVTDALNGVQEELAKCPSGQSTVDSEETLRWMVAGLKDMLASLEKSERTKPPGFWHAISDGWPRNDKLGDMVVDAEFVYKRLK